MMNDFLIHCTLIVLVYDIGKYYFYHICNSLQLRACESHISLVLMFTLFGLCLASLDDKPFWRLVALERKPFFMCLTTPIIFVNSYYIYSLTTIIYIFCKFIYLGSSIEGRWCCESVSLFSLRYTLYLGIESFKNILVIFSYFAAAMSDHIVLMASFLFCLHIYYTNNFSRFNLVRFLHFPSFFWKQWLLSFLHNFHILPCSSACDWCCSYGRLKFDLPLLYIYVIMLECPLLGRPLPQYCEWSTGHMRSWYSFRKWKGNYFLELYPGWCWTMFVFKCWQWNQHKYIHI